MSAGFARVLFGHAKTGLLGGQQAKIPPAVLSQVRGVVTGAEPSCSGSPLGGWGVIWSAGFGLTVGMLFSDMASAEDKNAKSGGSAGSSLQKAEGSKHWPIPNQPRGWASPAEPTLWTRFTSMFHTSTSDASTADFPIEASKLSCKRRGRQPGMEHKPVVLVSCGSFNPPTNMHLRMFHLAAHHLQQNGYDVLGGYVSPVNDAYKKPGLVSAGHRLAMCRAATEASPCIMVDAWEGLQPGYIRSLLVLQRLQNGLNQQFESGGVGTDISSGQGASRLGTDKMDRPTAPARVMLLCGADLVASIDRPGVWVESQVRQLLREHGLVCVSREDVDLQPLLSKPGSLLHEFRDNIVLVREPVANEMSSTRIRADVQQGRPIEYLTPQPVVDYIRQHGLYK